MNLHHNIINAAPMAMRRGHYVVHNHDHPHTSGGGVWGLIIVGAVLLVIAGFIALRVMMNGDARDNADTPTAPAPDTEAASTLGVGDQQGTVANDCSESAGG